MRGTIYNIHINFRVDVGVAGVVVIAIVFDTCPSIGMWALFVLFCKIELYVRRRKNATATSKEKSNSSSYFIFVSSTFVLNSGND